MLSRLWQTLPARHLWGWRPCGKRYTSASRRIRRQRFYACPPVQRRKFTFNRGKHISCTSDFAGAWLAERAPRQMPSMWMITTLILFPHGRALDAGAALAQPSPSARASDCPLGPALAVEAEARATRAALPSRGPGGCTAGPRRLPGSRLSATPAPQRPHGRAARERRLLGNLRPLLSLPPGPPRVCRLRDRPCARSQHLQLWIQRQQHLDDMLSQSIAASDLSTTAAAGNR